MKAYVVEKIADKKFTSSVQEVDIPKIKKNEVLIKTTYSSLNYKDALSSMGNSGVTKVFPHITGIDMAGTIEKSNSNDFKVGQKVLATGYDLGMNTNGGHSQYVKAPASWVVKLPKTITDKEIMSYGTAGLTAALSINELLNNNILNGKILVTGSTGGVGSIAISILNKIGFEVSAISRKEEKIEFLKFLGAKEVILAKDFDIENKKPMGSAKYDGVIDTVGGNTLSQALKLIKYNGIATCCGLTSSFKFDANLFPFILRGIKLIGIDSAECEIEKKKLAWEKISNEFKIDTLKTLVNEISLEEIKESYKKLLAGKAVGRYLVKISP